MVLASESESILLVDDDTNNIRTLAAALAEKYNLRFATSGKAVIALLDTGYKPDLILLDLLMPQMSGLDLFSKLKANSALENIPIIFLTANTDIQDEQLALIAGAADFLHKPIDVALVRTRIKYHLERARTWRKLEETGRQQKTLAENSIKLATQALRFKGSIMEGIDSNLVKVVDGILGDAKALKNADLSDVAKLSGEIYQKAAAIKDTLIQMVLAADLVANKVAIDSEPFCVLKLTAELENCLADKYKAKNLKVHYAFSEFLKNHLIWADRGKLFHTLKNILDNAFRYTTAGVVDVSFSTTERDVAIILFVTIKDTGVGIPADMVDGIFDIFHKTGYSSRLEGVGLGLPIAKALVDVMGGTIGLDTRFGLGTTVTVSMPIKVNEVGCANAAGKTYGPFLGTNVLVLEPNKILRGTLISILTSNGFITHAPKSTEEFRFFLENNIADIILLALDNEKYPRWLTELKQCANLHMAPIVGLTEYATNDKIADSIAKGVAEVISYKAKPQRLYEVLEKHLGRA